MIRVFSLLLVTCLAVPSSAGVARPNILFIIADDQSPFDFKFDNTYIFYTADHGMAIGRHGLQGRQNLYEHTWRVPLGVKGPAIEAGSRVRGNVCLLAEMRRLDDPYRLWNQPRGEGDPPPAARPGTGRQPEGHSVNTILVLILISIFVDTSVSSNHCSIGIATRVATEITGDPAYPSAIQASP